MVETEPSLRGRRWNMTRTSASVIAAGLVVALMAGMAGAQHQTAALPLGSRQVIVRVVAPAPRPPALPVAVGDGGERDG
jgi:hypothetical protein